MLRSVLSRAILVCIALLPCAKLTAGVPIVISHQGRLLDASDAPLSGSYTIVYSIYDAPVGGTQLWLEDHVGVQVTDGLFTVQLGTSVPLTADIFAGSGGGGGGTAGRYLQVQISGQPAIMPRTQLLSSPYSVASSRLSGDVQTAPGELKASAASDTKRIGIRVADSLAEASSIAIDEPGVQIAMRITPDSTVYDQGQDSGSRVMVHAVHRGENRISQTITPTTSSVAINTKGTGADKNRTIGNQCDDSSAVNYLDIDDDDDGHAEARGIIAVKSSTGSGSATASSQLLCDSDDDGLSDNEISQSVTPTTSNVAIKTKGTGADANKTATVTVSASPGGSANAISTVDTDGDNDPEGEISQSVTPTTSSMAINRKGTGADANKSASLTVTASPGGSASAISTVDLDGDDNPEGEISQIITPTTCGVAINTKGTGAAKGRTAGSQCDDSSAVNYLDADEDGDGHAEARGIIAVKSPSGSGSASASSRLSCDSDDDGLPDSEISQSVTPTVCGVAIKTKGTGADANRVLSIQSGATPDALSSVASIDDDGDTVPESEISQTVTPTTCGVAINTKGTGADKNRTIGSQCDDSSAVQYLDVDQDGDGHAEARGIISVKASTGSGSLSATVSSQMTCDSDDDGLPDSEISQSVTPTTCGVAINTKGTGAAKGRTAGSQCDDSSAVHYLDIDDDGDDIPEVSLREAATPSVAEIVVTKNQDVSSTDLRMAATDDSAVVVLGYDGLTTASLKLQVVSSGTANPIEHSSGAHLTAGGVWTNASDANLKENFRPVDGAELLEKIEELPVSEWNYKVESDAVTHIGPTAQDFQKVFGVGENDKSISTIDPSGIALAAIKELSKQNRELKDQNARLTKKLEDLAKKVEKLALEK